MFDMVDRWLGKTMKKRMVAIVSDVDAEGVPIQTLDTSSGRILLKTDETEPRANLEALIPPNVDLKFNDVIIIELDDQFTHRWKFISLFEG